jgi:hypothetical protein
VKDVYEDLWKAGRVPGRAVLVGKWRVTIVTGPLSRIYKFFSIQSHYKVIDGEYNGKNYTFGIPWGKFRIPIIDTNEEDRKFVYDSFIDYVRVIDKDLLIGKIWIGRKMWGYFTMHRVFEVS